MNMRTVSSLLLMGFCASVVLMVASTANSQASKPAARAATAGAQEGKAIYTKHCAVCHFAASDAKKVGPGLKGLAKRAKYADGKLITDDSLRTLMENGGKNMPGFKGVLNADQMRGLVAYLKTL